MKITILNILVVIVTLMVFARRATGHVQIGSDINGVAAGDAFGEDVSINEDGNVIAVTARNRNNGSVQVFEFSSTSWVQLGEDIESEVRMVSLNAAGTVVALGSASFTKVFAYNGSSWVQLGDDIDMITSSFSLSDDGTTVIICESFSSVRVFQYNSGSWMQVGPTMEGKHVDINGGGDIIAVGVQNSTNVFNIVYQYNGSDWVQLGEDINGDSVNLNDAGNILAVYYSMAVSVYEYNGSSWVQMGESILGGPMLSGPVGLQTSISNNGTILASRHLTGCGFGPYGPPCGGISVFKYNGSSWGQLGDEVPHHETLPGMAYSLSSDGSTIAVAYSEAFVSPDVGAVRVYTITNSSATASVSGDPHFTGFLGQRFEFQGRHGEVYNLISSAEVQINGRFLASGQWGDSRTFLDAISIQDAHDQFSVACMNGTLIATINGKRLGADAGVVSSEDMSVVIDTKQTTAFTLIGDVSVVPAKNRWASCYVNMDVSLSGNVNVDELHGLLGQTVRNSGNVIPSAPTKYEDGVFAIQGTDEDYHIDEGHLFGNSFRFNRFAGRK